MREQAGRTKLGVLVVLNTLVCISQVLGFVWISRCTRTYAAEELFGDTRLARHTVLPAWRPLLVGCCKGLCVITLAQLGLLAVSPSVCFWISGRRLGSWRPFVRSFVRSFDSFASVRRRLEGT